ncbi:hypothetical protein [Hufsiella ginkgonis]|uniref:DUF4595 domain-containing protein n=1 Tax=Hufsiella ginkgonis TaxID=2695274 RepID=A0A7K1XU59_9SPHI|nr:hypothetical protein [Hufsiella ginkgonis]MXV14545.1 hypothetical protein [Hufsiella ginkgonis]
MNSFKPVKIILFAATLLAFTACEVENLPLPETDTVKTPSPLPPGASNPPVDTTTIPTPGLPGTEVPQPLPQKAGMLRKATYSLLDYRIFNYDNQDRIIRYYSQYNSVQGTNIVSKFGYNFTYNAEGELTGMIEDNNLRTVYSNRNGVLYKAITYAPDNSIYRAYEFFFNQKKQLVIFNSSKDNGDGSELPERRVELTYDTRGNLVLWSEQYYNAATKQYMQATQLQFSDFDDKPSLKHSLTFGSVLQPLNFFVNNPGKKRFLNSSSPVEFYTYVYGADGYPVRRTTSYSYSKPLPEMVETYEF